MNLDHRGLALARHPFALTGLMCGMVALAAFRLHGLGDTARLRLDETMLQERSARHRLAQIEADAADRRQHLARYRQLAEHGLLGPERRTAWIERLARSKTERKLPELRFELAPRQPIDSSLLPGGAGDAHLEFMTSTMQLHLSLVHEDDLAGLLTDLADVRDALPLVRRCTVERLPPPHSTPARLKAECRIEWITIRERHG